MTLAAALYDPGRARDLATVAAEVVPILLVAAFAVPVPRVEKAKDARAALTEFVAVAILLALALLTETLALYGVAYGLGRVDQRLLFILLFLTAIGALRRMIAPLVRTYARDRRVPEARLWGILIAITLALSLGLVFLLAFVEQH